MRKTKSAFPVIALMALTVLFFGCQKDLKNPGNNSANNNASDEEIQTAKIQSLTDAEDAYELGLIFSANDPQAENNFASLSSSCPPKTIYKPSADVYPHKVIINYGFGCTSKNGITRSGKIIFTYTNDISVEGAKVETTYDNFFINGVKKEGKSIVVNNGLNNTGFLQFKLNYKDSKSIQPNGNYTVLNGVRKVLRKKGDGYPAFPDGGNFKITGTLNVTQLLGSTSIQYISDITSPLIYRANCGWISKGILTNTYSDLSKTILDYGNGDCDNIATLTTRKGNIVTVTLQ